MAQFLTLVWKEIRASWRLYSIPLLFMGPGYSLKLIDTITHNEPYTKIVEHFAKSFISTWMTIIAFLFVVRLYHDYHKRNSVLVLSLPVPVLSDCIAKFTAMFLFCIPYILLFMISETVFLRSYSQGYAGFGADLSFEYAVFLFTETMYNSSYAFLGWSLATAVSKYVVLIWAAVGLAYPVTNQYLSVFSSNTLIRLLTDLNIPYWLTRQKMVIVMNILLTSIILFVSFILYRLNPEREGI